MGLLCSCFSMCNCVDYGVHYSRNFCTYRTFIMNIQSIILLILIVILLIFAIIYSTKHKSACSGNCSNCNKNCNNKR
ncbi:MAG: FeoB-associated Cys-rich membrane protein [Eubacterium sp.]